MYHSPHQGIQVIITASTRNPLLVQYKHRLSEPVTSMCTVKPQKTNKISETQRYKKVVDHQLEVTRKSNFFRSTSQQQVKLRMD